MDFLLLSSAMIINLKENPKISILAFVLLTSYYHFRTKIERRCTIRAINPIDIESPIEDNLKNSPFAKAFRRKP